MARLSALARFVVLEFGPLVAFFILALTLGVKAAIVGSILVIAADAVWRRLRRLAFTRLYLLTSGLTLTFGAIDLFSAQPFMLSYEAVVTNAATGAAFVVGAFGAKPLIQEVAELGLASVTLLPGLDHMGVVHAPEALVAIREAATR